MSQDRLSSSGEPGAVGRVQIPVRPNKSLELIGRADVPWEILPPPIHGPDAFQPIVLPADWDEQKDCDHFLERWEPEPSYATVLWAMMRLHGSLFAAALDASLAYFQRQDATLIHVEPRCLSAREKIEALLEFAQASTRVAHFRNRLLADLQACEFTERERERVLREYRRARDEAWMYPVIEVIDYLGDAGVYLNETMGAENEDFESVLRRLQEEQDDDF